MTNVAAGGGIAAHAGRILRGDVTSTQLVEAAIQSACTHGDRLKAFISVYTDEALAEAREADRRIAAGDYRSEAAWRAAAGPAVPDEQGELGRRRPPCRRCRPAATRLITTDAQRRTA